MPASTTHKIAPVLADNGEVTLTVLRYPTAEFLPQPHVEPVLPPHRICAGFVLP